MSRSFGPKDPTAGPKSPLAMVSLQGRGVAESGSADVGELDAPASGTFDITLSGALASRLGGCMLTSEASTLSGPIDPIYTSEGVRRGTLRVGDGACIEGRGT